MRGNSRTARSKSRRHSTFHLSPITQAVRAALAVSAIALAGTGPVFAGGCDDAAQTRLVRCNVPERAHAPVADLTSVTDREVPTSVVASDPHLTDMSGITGADANALGSSGVSTLAFDVDITNSGTINQSGSGDKIGIDAEFAGADITIVNTGSGDIHAESTDGLADGIFAYGAEITVDNRGSIQGDGYTWGAGIEAQGDSVTVDNRGDISASASANVAADPYAGTAGIYGRAYGVYAVGYGDDGIVVNNRGTIDASGVYATGVYTYDAGGGGTTINNRGDISATADYGIAAGVKTVSNLGASETDVSNNGSIQATGTYGASGIAVTATGLGASASVDNRGDIYAASTAYYSIAEGIAVSADDDASLRNRGAITVGYGDYAYGGLALAFAGDADINNTGDVLVYGGLSGYGFVAASQNGTTGVTNNGAITVDSSLGTAAGIDASSLAGTDVRNNGDIGATASTYAFGVRANSAQGDTVVDNRGTIATDGKYSFGVWAQSGDGNATVDNRGTITGSGKYAYGAVAASNYGDALIANTEDGSITGYSSDLLAVGTFANANNDGNATIDNDGTIAAIGAGYAQLAYGAVVQTGAGDALVTNNGAISASNSYGAARGVIVRSSTGGDVAVDNHGDISAVATGSGVYVGYYGTYVINTDAIGVYASAPGAEASITNSGSITASTEAGLADGVFASAETVDVTNTGSITAHGYTQGAGIQASSNGDVTIDNSGAIAAYGQNYAFGIYAQAGNGLASITNTADIHAGSIDADAIGVYAGGVYGDVALDNAASGSVSADSTNGTATALVGASYYGNVAVSNEGVLDANTAHSNTASSFAIGIIGNTFSPYGGDVELTNASGGSISATADNTAAKGMMALSYHGDIGIINAGDMTASGSGAIGIYAYSVTGAADIDNSGSITATSEDGLADGVFASAATSEVTNSGTITAHGYTWGAGIEAQGVDAATVSNSGDIDASANAYYAADPASGNESVYGHAYGIYASSLYGDGGVSVDNRGTIAATGPYATGVYAYDGGDGGIGITNRGDITASAVNGIAAGIDAVTSFDASDIEITNRGNVATSDYNAAYAVTAVATGAGSGVDVTNTGELSAIATDDKYGPTAGVIASGDGDVAVRNTRTGTIYASGGYVYGLAAMAFAGDADTVNAGKIDITGNHAYGAIASSQNGTASATNRGDIAVSGTNGVYGIARGVDASGVDAEVVNRGSISSYGKYSRGISAVASAGDAEVRNAASVYGGGKYSYGIAGISTDGDVRLNNTGNGKVEAYTYASIAVGMLGISTYDDVEVSNAGHIIARGDSAGLTAGVYASSDNNDVSVSNRGSMNANTVYGNAFGVLANIGGNDELGVVNRGDITATSTYANATGIDATSAYGGEVSLRNAGTITASSSVGNATGLAGAAVGGELALRNTAAGSIDASTVDGDATGMLGVLSDADLTINNAGSITATSTNGNAYAIRIESAAPVALSATAADQAADRQTSIMPLIDRNILVATGEQAAAGSNLTASVSATGTATVTNRGSIVARSGTGQGVAIYGGDGVEQIINRGTIQGAILTHGGDDIVINQRHGEWQFNGTRSDFGAGDDRFTNAAGAMLQMHDAAIAFGTGTDRIINQGTIVVSGHNAIDMTGGSAAAVAAALKRPKHTASFMNNGVISMLDGAADDSLTVTGSFGGKGDIDLDVSLDNNRNDALFVQGGMLNGSKQHVNVVLLDGLPRASDVGSQLELVHVDGDTNPSVFKAGKVRGVSPRDFMDVGLKLSSTPVKHSADGTSYMLKVKTYVNGLNAAGVLASSTALAVDSLMSSTMGDHGARTYMTMAAAPGKQSILGVTPWVRRFNDKGGMNPDHMASNFGQMAKSDLNQDNYGTQMGLEYRAGNGFRFGTMFAKSQGQQYLADDRGRNRIIGHTMGMYGTWVSPSGLYVDASWRSMQFQSYIDSIGGHQRSDGHAVGTRFEVGRSWKLGNGLTIAPRMRYTTTTVDGVSIDGYQATFKSQDTHWKRASLGVSLHKTFIGATGWEWTPYGEVNVVQTLDGVTNYAINQDYFGQVMTKGTSEQMKLGLSAHKGKLQWSGGVNWLDGGNIDGALGARMTLRYSW